YGLPSYARQTGQRCAACHVGGNWPQLTPWGRFFKLAGYSAGKTFIDREGFQYAPVGGLVRTGVTWAAQPTNSQGQTVIAHNGNPELYDAFGELGTKFTDWSGIFLEYGVNNTFPGWKGVEGPVDIRATHFFHPGNHELLAGFDMNNAPTLQDVWNTIPAWTFPFYGSPQAPGAPASVIMNTLPNAVGSIGAYALFDRHIYAEVSMYHVGNDFFRFMNGGTAFNKVPYLHNWSPYWRAYWTTDKGPNVWMAGSFGMQAGIYPNSAVRSGPTNNFYDTGFDAQYQHLGDSRKLTVRAAYIYEQQHWWGSYPLGTSAVPKSNIKTVDISGSYALGDKWTFSAAYLLTNGTSNAALYGVSDPNGNLLSSKPNTTGYTLEIDRTLTQNILAMVQYKGFSKFNGLSNNIDGLGRKPYDNNTLWINLFFAF
ncbi:MAG: hypothetical protein JO270_22505, partial [Acidobacteriaceae bacterium]|nr:hypothetical protein [Acidobacteriaceae bacterium]